MIVYNLIDREIIHFHYENDSFYFDIKNNLQKIERFIIFKYEVSFFKEAVNSLVGYLTESFVFKRIQFPKLDDVYLEILLKNKYISFMIIDRGKKVELSLPIENFNVLTDIIFQMEKILILQ